MNFLDKKRARTGQAASSSKLDASVRLWISCCSVLFLLSVLVASCGKMTGGASGETHFLSPCDGGCDGGLQCLCGVCTRPCTGADGCSDLASGATCEAPASCEAAICDVRCHGDGDCEPLGLGFRCEAGSCRRSAQVSLQCPAGCQQVMGYPQDADGQCADLSRGEPIACVCEEPEWGGSCARRTSDGTLWAVTESTSLLPGFEYCAPSEQEQLRASCDFAHCENRPASYCSYEDTCAVIGCDSLQYEQGCRRQTCGDDSECADSERCVSVHADYSFCTYSIEGVCGCSGPDIIVWGSFCNPVAEVGPRGAWQSLEILRSAGSCEEGVDCMWRWSVSPDGTIAMEKQGAESTAEIVDAWELQELNGGINGPGLRRELRDGPNCGAPPPDVSVSMRLVLPDQTLEAVVTGCVLNGPVGNPFLQVYQLVTAY